MIDAIFSPIRGESTFLVEKISVLQLHIITQASKNYLTVRFPSHKFLTTVMSMTLIMSWTHSGYFWKPIPQNEHCGIATPHLELLKPTDADDSCDK